MKHKNTESKGFSETHPSGSTAQRKREKIAGQQLPPKLTPPRPMRLYPRERLFELLDRSRQDHPVIWVSASGGAGKTSLATSYLAARNLPVVWYQVDAGDGDVASFFYYMGMAAARAAPRHKKPLPTLTPEYLGDLPTFTRNFFRELYRRLPASSVLVFDNYQDAPEDVHLHDVVRIALEEVPNGLNVFVLSRANPPAALARLQLCEQAACLDSRNMQLTREETAGIGAARIGDAALSRDQIDGLHSRADGWAAGVVLLIEQSISNARFDPAQAPTDQKLLFDYFASEILQRSEAEVQDFLLKTAFFTKITLTSALTLTGNQSSYEILESLTRRNYFTVCHAGAQESNYEYHPLFREFLLAQAQTSFDSATLAALRLEAAHILVQAGEIEEAALLFQQSQSWAELAELLCVHAPVMIIQGRWQTVADWFGRLPEELYPANPLLWYWRGVGCLPFDPRAARADLERCYLAFKAIDDSVMQCRAWSAIVDSFVYEWADVTPLDAWIKEMEQFMREHPQFPNPEIEVLVVCGMFLALMYRQPQHPRLPDWVIRVDALVMGGDDARMRAYIGTQLLLYYTWWIGNLAKGGVVVSALESLMSRPDTPPLVAVSWCGMSAAYYWMIAENAKSVQAADAGLALAESSGVHIMDIALCNQALFATLSSGDLNSARRYLDKVALSINPARFLDNGMHYHLRAWYSLARGDVARAAEEAALCKDYMARTGTPFFIPYGHMMLGLIRHYQGRSEDGLELVRSARALGHEHNSVTVEYLTWLAEAEILLDDDQAACRDALRHSFAVSRTQGFLNHTWWRNAAMARLCAEALDANIEPDYVRSLIIKRGLLPPANQSVPDTWPFPIKIYTLGHFALLKHDQPLAATGKGHKKPMLLLQTLIALGGHQIGVNRIIDLLWPDAEGDAAANLFRVTIHRLRKLLGHESAIEFAEGRLTLSPKNVWVDTWALARALNNADTGNTDAMRYALVLYRGHFLEHETENNPTLLRNREQLRTRIMRAVKGLLRALERDGNWVEFTHRCERAIELDELDEDFHSGALRGYLAQGQPAQALRAFERAKRIYQSLNLQPSPRLEALRAQAAAT